MLLHIIEQWSKNLIYPIRLAYDGAAQASAVSVLAPSLEKMEGLHQKEYVG